MYRNFGTNTRIFSIYILYEPFFSSCNFESYFSKFFKLNIF